MHKIPSWLLSQRLAAPLAADNDLPTHLMPPQQTRAAAQTPKAWEFVPATSTR